MCYCHIYLILSLPNPPPVDANSEPLVWDGAGIVGPEADT